MNFSANCGKVHFGTSENISSSIFKEEEER